MSGNFQCGIMRPVVPKRQQTPSSMHTLGFRCRCYALQKQPGNPAAYCTACRHGLLVTVGSIPVERWLNSPVIYLHQWIVALINLPSSLIFPALFNSFPHTLCIFFAVIFVQVRGFDVGRRASVGVIKQTKQ